MISNPVSKAFCLLNCFVSYACNCFCIKYYNVVPHIVMSKAWGSRPEVRNSLAIRTHEQTSSCWHQTWNMSLLMHWLLPGLPVSGHVYCSCPAGSLAWFTATPTPAQSPGKTGCHCTVLQTTDMWYVNILFVWAEQVTSG